jgi:hypothetical protein
VSSGQHLRGGGQLVPGGFGAGVRRAPDRDHLFDVGLESLPTPHDVRHVWRRLSIAAGAAIIGQSAYLRVHGATTKY